MISVILTQNSIIRDAFANALSLEKKEILQKNIVSYQKGKWVLVFSETESLQILSDFAGENYAPDFAYIPHFGTSIDVVHEIGDVILPNVLLSYNSDIATVDITTENRDALLGKARFLEIYPEQKDYYIEDFGLSIGGIVLDKVERSLLEEAPDRLMAAYEADVYVSDTLDAGFTLAGTSSLPTVLLAGVIEWKPSKNIVLDPFVHTVRNMITTIRLLEDEGV